MPFPFLPVGAALALGVLVGAFAGFGLALRLVDRAALTARSSIAPGIVSGLRNWNRQAQPAGRTSSRGAGEPPLAPLTMLAWPHPEPDAPQAPLEELQASILEEIDHANVPTEPVHRP